MTEQVARILSKSTVAIVFATLVTSTAVGQHANQPVRTINDPCNFEFNSSDSQGALWRVAPQRRKATGDLLHLTDRSELSSKCNLSDLSSSRSIAHRNLEDLTNSEGTSSPKIGKSSNFEFAQGQGAPPADDAQELAKKLSNPVAALISVPLQSNFDFGMGAGSGWRYTLNVQPVVPFKLSDKWNLISRTILPIIHQGNVTGPGTGQSGLGDITQSFFFSPSKTEPFIWAVGPVALLPTATDSRLGTQKWGLGPTVLVLKQEHGWTYGILANHIWSVAGKSNRSSVNSTFLQPFLSYSTKDAWTYSINTESTYDWVTNSWAVPINPLVSKLVRFGKQPISFGGGVKCWVTSPAGGPQNCSLRIVVTALFPK